MNISTNGVSFIKSFEGCKLEAYLDSAHIPTIGYGCIIYPSGTPVAMGDTITQEEANTLLMGQLKRFVDGVNTLVTSSLNQNQFDSLVSFSYNEGLGALRSSSLLKKVNADSSDSGITGEFEKWCKAGGEVIQGLLNRRKAEAALYFL